MLLSTVSISLTSVMQVLTAFGRVRHEDCGLVRPSSLALLYHSRAEHARVRMSDERGIMLQHRLHTMGGQTCAVPGCS